MSKIARLLAPRPPSSHASEDQLEPRDQRVTWGPLAAVFYTVVVYFVSQYGAYVLILLYPLSQHWASNRITTWLNNSALAEFFTVAIIESLVIIMLRWFLTKRKTGFAALGWWRRPLLTDVAYLFAGFAVYFISLNFIIFPVIRALIPSLNFSQKQDIGFSGAHGPILILVFISLAVLPPLVEETLVRGFLYTGLRTKVPIYAAAIITSIMFAAAHLELGSGQPALWTAAIDTFTLSLVLIYLRQKTNSLYASVGVHFLKNSLAFAALFIFHLT